MTFKDWISKGVHSLSVLYGQSESESLMVYLLEHTTRYSRSHIQLYFNGQVDEKFDPLLEFFLQRLLQGEPVQYIIGEVEFADVNILVSPSVLIPRPETEELVYLIRKGQNKYPKTILDICSGSGCIAISLAKYFPISEVVAWEISPEAISLAEKSASMNSINVKFIEMDVLHYTSHDMPEYDIIVSNPPYVQNSEKALMHANVLDYEPHLALFVEDNDPLVFYRQIADIAVKNLSNLGQLYLEINEAKGSETVEMLISKGFSDVKLLKDFRDKDRFILAIK